MLKLIMNILFFGQRSTAEINIWTKLKLISKVECIAGVVNISVDTDDQE